MRLTGVLPAASETPDTSALRPGPLVVESFVDNPLVVPELWDTTAEFSIKVLLTPNMLLVA